MTAAGAHAQFQPGGIPSAMVMGAGARYLAAIWDAAFAAASASLPPEPAAIPETKLADIYKDTKFVPSVTLDKIDAFL